MLGLMMHLIKLKKLQSNEILVYILKQNADVLFWLYLQLFNFCLNEEKFPNILKQANLTPASRKGNRSSKENCRPLSILPVIAKYLQTSLVSKQLTLFMDEFFI